MLKMFKLHNSTRLVIASGFIICILLLGNAYQPSVAQAQSSLLGTAQRFAVLGGSTVTNTGATTVNRDLGVSPGSAVTGFPPGIVTGGSIHAADAVASQAQSDVTNAYNVLAGEACNFNLTGQDLGGMTLIEGVYCFSTSAQLTGQLTLDAQGNSAARFVFQIGSTLTTASNASVLMIGGSPCNVFWQVGSSATLGTTTRFVGNILALTSITLNTGATLNGRALAQNGAVTMDTNSVSAASCTPAQEPEEPTATPETPTATPETPTATPETPAPSTPTPVTPAPSTPTPVTPAPGTPTPVSPAPGEPTPVSPAPGQPTPVNPGPTTPTPITPAPGEPTPLTPIPGTPGTATPAPGAPTQTPGTPGTPGAPTPVTPVGTGTTTPVTATPVTPTAPGGPTRTPTSTATAISTVSFPNTGSGGMSTKQTDQPMALTTLAISLAIVMLLTGGLGVVVQRRRR